MLKKSKFLLLLLILLLTISACTNNKVLEQNNYINLKTLDENKTSMETEETFDDGEDKEREVVFNSQYYKVIGKENQEIIELTEDEPIVQEIIEFLNGYEQEVRNINYETYKGFKEAKFWSERTLDEYIENTEKDFDELIERLNNVKLKLKPLGVTDILELAIGEDETRALVIYTYGFVIEEATDEYLQEGLIEKGTEYMGSIAMSLLKEDNEWKILERVENPFNN